MLRPIGRLDRQGDHVASEAMDAMKDQLRADRATAAGGPAPAMADARAGMDARFAALPAVPGATCVPVLAGGVPSEWVVPERVTAGGTVLYFHGGAYCVGSIVSHRRLVTALGVAAGARVLNVDYRLAPEHPFPAALDDALAAYRWLIGPAEERPEQVVIAGDSAGGGLALAALIALREAGDRLPRAAMVFSPWTDLTCSGASIQAKAADDPVLTHAGLLARVPLYLPDGDPAQPLVSPLFADLHGLPPMLLQVGEDEIIYDDSARFVDKATAAGVAAELDPCADAYHVFQLMVGLLPEADVAVARAGAWINRQLPAVAA